ncbi:type VI secretion system lipoprotein TssJ [Massilia sp. H6]|uniref:type VI secretion system lipoprotein TssJ n=1 Tax=Massilia sp. H6 TaxID=2970464 RepID=UPI0021682AE3|nr:type VI secretion system lipoprotein TssJ [Massilia sp. H6]UVW30329.1 type VI secretion system lipoprotein TssJ [Massilia sp. H6]
MRKIYLLALGLAAALSGCASNGMAGAALEAVGLRKPPELPDAQKAARTVALRLHASHKLNADRNGQPLALAVRIYQLRHKEAFEQAPYAVFLSPQAERANLGSDLVQVREIMLVPGQRYEVLEKVGREASHLAVVALFQRPAAGRWRASFPAGEAERTGLTLGLHACALTAGASSPAPSLSSVRCQ